MAFEPKHAVPVFPLPGLILFPGVHLALHVFELRYRTMVRDALSRGRLLALALLLPGWERDYQGSPEFHPLGCLARIDEVTWMPNDCYDLRLVGLSRVRLGRAEREFPYRAVHLHVLPQDPLAEDDPLVQLERRALLEANARLTRLTGREDRGGGEGLGFEPLVNGVCMELPVEPAAKLQLLELDSLLDRARRARETMEEQLRGAGRLPAGGGERN